MFIVNFATNTTIRAAVTSFIIFCIYYTILIWQFRGHIFHCFSLLFRNCENIFFLINFSLLQILSRIYNDLLLLIYMRSGILLLLFLSNMRKIFRTNFSNPSFQQNLEIFTHTLDPIELKWQEFHTIESSNIVYFS